MFGDHNITHLVILSDLSSLQQGSYGDLMSSVIGLLHLYEKSQCPGREIRMRVSSLPKRALALWKVFLQEIYIKLWGAEFNLCPMFQRATNRWSQASWLQSSLCAQRSTLIHHTLQVNQQKVDLIQITLKAGARMHPDPTSLDLHLIKG